MDNPRYSENVLWLSEWIRQKHLLATTVTLPEFPLISLLSMCGLRVVRSYEDCFTRWLPVRGPWFHVMPSPSGIISPTPEYFRVDPTSYSYCQCFYYSIHAPYDMKMWPIIFPDSWLYTNIFKSLIFFRSCNPFLPIIYYCLDCSAHLFVVLWFWFH